MWDEALLFKLKTYSVKGELLNLLRNHLHKHNQTVVLNDQISSWELIKSGVPQGSVLSPFLFLIYINIQCTCNEHALLRIYKSFIRPHLDYGDIIYDKPHNKSFQNKIENIQYKACIGVTGAIQGTSREHLYHELGLESLGDQ